MPQIFLPPEALEYLRRCAVESFQEEVKVAKEYAVSASVYHVQDRVERYQKFIDQLKHLHISQQALIQLRLDPTVPEEVLMKIRSCIRRGNVHRDTEPFMLTVDNVYTMIVNHNIHQCYLDHDHPIGDEKNIRAELFLEAALEVENALELLGGPKGLTPPIGGISRRGETAIQTAFVILDGIASQVLMAGRSIDGDEFWWRYSGVDELLDKST